VAGSVGDDVAGVSNAVSGYAGGDKASAKYRLVGSGLTGMPNRCR